MAVLYTNNASGRLAGSVDATQTSISLQAGEGARFPNPGAGDWFPITAVKPDGELEVMRCTSRTNDLLTVVREQEGTTAKEFSAGHRVSLRITTSLMDQLKADALAVRTLTTGDGLSGGGDLSANRTLTVDSSVVRTARNIGTGAGLSGGGDLSADRTLSVDGTVVRTSRNIATGSGLSGGGNLSTDRTLTVDSSVVRTTRTVSGGNGLTGGGDLTTNRTITLGSPSTLNGGTTNAVTAGSHTHAISSTASRTDASTTTLLTAAGMNNHRTSADHDGRYALRGRTISAGAGLSGGGDLVGDRTISMGTPGTLSGTTSNATTATSHTHNVAVASTALAQAGSNNSSLMTPLRTKEALNASGSAPTYACRAWVNFDGTTTPPTIRASGNVSSVTRIATGLFEINLAVGLPDTNFSVIGTCYRGASLSGLVSLYDSSFTSTSSFQISMARHASSSAVSDNISLNSISVFR